jgi:hypothetical protein
MKPRPALTSSSSFFSSSGASIALTPEKIQSNTEGSEETVSSISQTLGKLRLEKNSSPLLKNKTPVIQNALTIDQAYELIHKLAGCVSKFCEEFRKAHLNILPLQFM